MGIRICPSCGGKVALSRNDCPHCSYDFDAQITCPECGDPVSKDVKECPTCGHLFVPKEEGHEPIKEEAAPAPAMIQEPSPEPQPTPIQESLAKPEPKKAEESANQDRWRQHKHSIVQSTNS